MTHVDAAASVTASIGVPPLLFQCACQVCAVGLGVQSEGPADVTNELRSANAYISFLAGM